MSDFFIRAAQDGNLERLQGLTKNHSVWPYELALEFAVIKGHPACVAFLVDFCEPKSYHKAFQHAVLSDDDTWACARILAPGSDVERALEELRGWWPSKRERFDTFDAWWSKQTLMAHVGGASVLADKRKI